jgi:hypothetical protein
LSVVEARPQIEFWHAKEAWETRAKLEVAGARLRRRGGLAECDLRELLQQNLGEGAGFEVPCASFGGHLAAPRSRTSTGSVPVEIAIPPNSSRYQFYSQAPATTQDVLPR